MKKAIIYGATDTGKKIYREVAGVYDVVCFVDENPALEGKKIDGVEIKNVECIEQSNYDVVVVGVLSKYMKVVNELISYGVDETRIITKYVDLPNRARESFVIQLGTYFGDHCIKGAVAELGVYQGEFSRIIGKAFSNSKFYLFDTFEGFEEKDVLYERDNNFSPAKKNYFSDTSVEQVLSVVPNNKRCIVKKGYFPETAVGVDDNFVFVNLDVDLYKPTVAGLEFFWEKMVFGGVVLVHDYFSEVYTGVRKAVDEFCDNNKLFPIPIGDTYSVALIKQKEDMIYE